MIASRSVMRFVVGLSLLSLACSPPRVPRDPFAGGDGTRREGVREFQVRLEVGCDRCLIRYSFGPSEQSAAPSRADQIWSRRVNRYPLQPEAVRLTASTGTDGGVLGFVRIWVDGKLVAEEEASRNDPTFGAGSSITLSAETIIGR